MSRGRGRGRGRGGPAGRAKQQAETRRSWGVEPTAAREDLERRWRRRMRTDPALARLVTGVGGREEPYHRWLSYRQAFSPELVRHFLTQSGYLRGGDLRLLDPFAGAGTFPIECARQGVPAVGAEALPSLVFVANARGEPDLPPFPDVTDCLTWQHVAERLEHPLHRAILIFAVSRRHTSEGKPNVHAPPLLDVLGEVLAMVRKDQRVPLAAEFSVHTGDARNLTLVPDDSIGGVLTSPPYLSRHEYTQINKPRERVYQFWYGKQSVAAQRDAQVRASPRAHAQEWSGDADAALVEVMEALAASGQKSLSGIARSYCDDLARVLAEWRRVLRRGAPAWVVIGGARLKDIYVPADLIFADQALASGFDVEDLIEARELIRGGRKLGGLARVTARETIVVLRKR